MFCSSLKFLQMLNPKTLLWVNFMLHLKWRHNLIDLRLRHDSPHELPPWKQKKKSHTRLHSFHCVILGGGCCVAPLGVVSANSTGPTLCDPTRRLSQDLNTNVTLGALCAHFQATVYSPSSTPTFASSSTPTLSSGLARHSSASVSLICVSLDRFLPYKFSKWSSVVFNGSFIDIKAVLSFQRCPLRELIWYPGMWRVCLYFPLAVVTRSLVRIILNFFVLLWLGSTCHLVGDHTSSEQPLIN